MIITFCGHSQIAQDDCLFERTLSAIMQSVKEEVVCFYLGGYGDFDNIALRACKKYKESHPTVRIVFVTPYLSQRYLKNREVVLKRYDEVVFPEIENVLPRFAILKRNEWMVKKADFVIAYVNYGWGGAANTLAYAFKQKKPFLNLGQKVF